jgi:hypothetical protein
MIRTGTGLFHTLLHGARRGSAPQAKARLLRLLPRDRAARHGSAAPLAPRDAALLAALLVGGGATQGEQP